MRTHSMRKILAALAIASVALVAGAFAQTPQPANNVLGDVIAVDAASKQIFVKTDAGAVGVVTALKPETKEITVQTRTAEGPKPVVIPTSGANVKLTRYAPDSIKFSERKPATFEEVKVGDQLRAKGDRSEDGARFNAEEIVTGTFRIAVGAITAVDASKNEFTIKQLQGNQPLTVVVRPDTILKQIPPEAMAMMGGMGGPGAGGPGGGQRQGGQGQGAGAGQGSGQGGVAGAGNGSGAGQAAGQGGGQGQGPGGGGQRRGGGADFMQQMLERLPPVTLAELKPGQLVIVSSTVGADPTRVTAIQLVSNIEPLVAMMSRRPGAGGGGLGPGGFGGGGGGLSFGFGIRQP